MSTAFMGSSFRSVSISSDRLIVSREGGRIPAHLPDTRREEEVVPLRLPSPLRLSGEKSLKAARASYGVSSYKMLKGTSTGTRRTALHPASAHNARNVVSGSPKVPNPSP